MKISITLILQIIATILWFLAAIPLPWGNKYEIGWLGAFFFGLSIIFKN